MKTFPNYKVASISSLVPYARNSRTHSAEQVGQVAESIREFGFTNPVLVDGDGGIIAGHGRVLAAQKLGMTEVPVIELTHLTEIQKRAYIIADNKLALNASWDDVILALELADLTLEGFDMDLTGFCDDEIAKIIDLPTELQEKTEVLRPIRWTRILISIPVGVSVDGMDEVLRTITNKGGEVDYGGN